MMEPNEISERQRELFVKKSARIAASYLKRAKALTKIPDAAMPFFDVLEKIYIKMEDIPKPKDKKSIGTVRAVLADPG